MVTTDSFDILGIHFDRLDYDQVAQQLREWRRHGRRAYITLTNPHSVLLAHRHPAMGYATRNAHLTLPDGIGIVLAARLLGYGVCHRVTGPALMLNLCDVLRPRGFRHFFYGGAPHVAQNLADRLRSRYPGLEVAGTFCPPFRPLSPEEDAAIVTQINRSQPDIVWVGLGAPKQEIWMARHVGRIQATALIGVGAAFDFHSGRRKWAPAWMRAIGLEWIHRLCLEPRRMWRRNLDSPLFLLKVFAQRLGYHVADPGTFCNEPWTEPQAPQPAHPGVLRHEPALSANR